MKILSSSAALHLPTVNARSGQATKQSKSTKETHDNLAHFRPSIDVAATVVSPPARCDGTLRQISH